MRQYRGSRPTLGVRLLTRSLFRVSSGASLLLRVREADESRTLGQPRWLLWLSIGRGARGIAHYPAACRPLARPPARKGVPLVSRFYLKKNSLGACRSVQPLTD